MQILNGVIYVLVLNATLPSIDIYLGEMEDWIEIHFDITWVHINETVYLHTRISHSELV